MKTKIKTIHEEEITQNDMRLNIGVLLNSSIEGEVEFNESFIYTYRDKTYVFFNTIIDMINYQLYGEKNMIRFYLDEQKFDDIYDAEYIEGRFIELINQ